MILSLTIVYLCVQDKAQHSERMLAEMAAQMQQLRVEKEELLGRNNLLEALLKVRQQQQHDTQGVRHLDGNQVGIHGRLMEPLFDSLMENPYGRPSWNPSWNPSSTPPWKTLLEPLTETLTEPLMGAPILRLWTEVY